MIFSDILREFFGNGNSVGLSYGHFFLFMFLFVGTLSGSIVLVNFLWNKILK